MAPTPAAIVGLRFAALVAAALAVAVLAPAAIHARRDEAPPPFVIAVWAPCPQDVPIDVALGIQTFVGALAPCDEDDVAAAVGDSGDVIDSLSDDPASGDYDDIPDPEPNQVGYVQPDEPDLNGIPPAALIQPAPGNTVLLNVTLNCWSTENCAPYFAKGTILTTDVYPLEEDCDSPGYVNVGTDYDAQRALAATGKSNFQWLEANAIGGRCGYHLTPVIVQAEAMETLEAGATGLGWFFPSNFDGSGTWESFVVPDDIEDAVESIDEQALDDQQIWLSPKLNVATPWGNGQPTGPGSNPIKVGGRLYGGRSYLFATNSTAATVVWKRALPGLAAGAKAPATDRTLGAPSAAHQLVAGAGGVLTDTFAPYSTHLYTWAAGAPAPKAKPKPKPKPKLKPKKPNPVTSPRRPAAR